MCLQQQQKIYQKSGEINLRKNKKLNKTVLILFGKQIKKSNSANAQECLKSEQQKQNKNKKTF